MFHGHERDACARVGGLYLSFSLIKNLKPKIINLRSREGLQRKARSKVERRGTLRGLVAESPTWSFYGGARPKKANSQNKISDKSFILDEENWSKSIIFASNYDGYFNIIRFSR